MKNDNNSKNGDNKYIWIYVVSAILIIAIGIAAYFILSNNSEEKEDDQNVAYTNLIKDVDEGKIEKIEMTVGSTSVKLKYRDEEEKKFMFQISNE